MVRATLADLKTQTRRIIKPQPAAYMNVLSPQAGGDHRVFPGQWSWGGNCGAGWMEKPFTCPYGQPGDRLWVRENITQRQLVNFLTGEPTKLISAAYAADDEDVEDERGFQVTPWWKGKKPLPSIHMPRWASRLTLEITDVRVQRLQEISEEDARAEGVQCEVVIDGQPMSGCYWDYLLNCWSGAFPNDAEARGSFRTLWESINGPGSWDLNPWVWAISFKRIDAQRRELEASWTSLSIPTPTPKATP